MLFDNILINPITEEKLEIDWNTSQILNIDHTTYQAVVQNGIPVIRPRKTIKDLEKTDLHNKTNSAFDYIDHYQKDAEEFNYFFEYDSAVARDENKRLHQKVIDQIPKNAGIVLDVGCGNGWLAKKVADDKTKVISMDISTINPAKALEQFPNPNHYGLVADVFHLPLASESVDCIVASEIIEHVVNPKLFVEHLVRPLKKEGKLIITTPYNEKLEYSLCVHCNKPTPRNAHIHSFNIQNIENLIPPNIRYRHHHLMINSILTKLRIYAFLGFLPFWAWNLLDKMANAIIKKAVRLMIVIEK